MSPARPVVTVEAYPALTAALDRHLGWARDFARAGDLESAIDAMRDAQATYGELFAAETSRAVSDRLIRHHGSDDASGNHLGAAGYRRRGR